MTALAFARPSLDQLVPSMVSPVAGALRRAGATLASWKMRSRTRADLRAMCPTRYGDIGLTAFDVRGEMAKPFWRA